MKILEEFIIRHLKKSKARIKSLNYYYNNKKKITKQRENNRIKLRKNNKTYREKNKERLNKQKRDWSKKNKEKIDTYNKKNPQLKVISQWKKRGVVSDNYMILYDKWKNTKNCENCKVELTDGLVSNTKRVLDHSHITGEFRNILCHLCNIRRGETNI